MSRGSSADPLGKASVYWGEIIGMTSPRTFDVQVASGDHHYGPLLAAPAGQLAVGQSVGSPVNLAMADYGTKFMIVAGLLNVISAVDAHQIAIGKKS